MAWEPDYITTTEFKNYVLIELGDTVDDTFVALDITAASRAIDKFCSTRPNGMGARRQFGKVSGTQTRYYSPRWDRRQARWVIEIDDLASATGLVVECDQDNNDVFEATITNYVLRPRDALVNNRVFTQISVGISSAVQPFEWPDSVRVTSDQWGWPAFPDVVRRACLLQTHRFNKRRTAPFGIAGAQQNNSEVYKMDRVDPDVEQMLSANQMIKMVWTPS